MKSIMKRVALLFALGILGTACDSDNKGGGGSPEGLPSQQTLSAFAKDFPGAEQVTWSKKKGYDVAYFVLKGTRATVAGKNSAWYPEGSGKCTYKKLEISWEQLQKEAPAVATAWENSSYKRDGYVLDDIDRMEYTDGEMPTYKLEAELRDAEYELTYRQDGTLLSERLDANDEDEDEEDDPAPKGIFDFVATHLPDAVILDSESETENNVTYFEVEILYKREATFVEADLIFNDRYAFQAAVEEIEEEDFTNPTILPAPVYQKFRELCKDGDMDDVRKIYTTIADFIAGTNASYAITVETEDDHGDDVETTYLLDAEGNVIE